MPVAERLGSLRRVGLDEATVAVDHVQREVVDGLLHSPDYGTRLAEVALRLAGRMRQRHVHLPRPQAMLAHVVLD